MWVFDSAETCRAREREERTRAWEKGVVAVVVVVDGDTKMSLMTRRRTATNNNSSISPFLCTETRQ